MENIAYVGVMIVILLIIGVVYYKWTNKSSEGMYITREQFESKFAAGGQTEMYEAPSNAQQGSVEIKTPDVTSNVESEVGSNGTYQDHIEKVALEAGVAESHRRFVSEAPHRTTVSSRDVERDDPNDVVSWVGLKRPKYQESVASSQSESRVVSSESTQQMPVYKSFTI